jgi:branched-subunit amino acid transport protein
MIANTFKYIPIFLLEVGILFSVYGLFFLIAYFSPALKKRLPIFVYQLMFFIAVTTIAGFVGSSLLSSDLDGWQVFLNTSLPIVLVGVFIIVLAMFSHSKWQATFALGVFVAITLFSIKFNPFPLANACFYHSGNKYSKQYITALQNNIKPNWQGGFLCDSSAYIGKFQNSPIIKFMALPLAELQNSPILLSLNSYKLGKADKFKREMYLKQSLFMEFVKQQEEKHEFIAYENSQLEFVKLYHLQFIITSKDIALPPSIDSLYVICSHDKASNETLYIEKTIK